MIDYVTYDGTLKENEGRPQGYVSKINPSKDRKSKEVLKYPLPTKKVDKKPSFLAKKPCFFALFLLFG